MPTEDERPERSVDHAVRSGMLWLAIMLALATAAVSVGGFVAAGGDLAGSAARHHLAAVGLAVMAARAADLSRARRP